MAGTTPAANGAPRTAADLLRMPEPDGTRYELVDGALRVMTPASGIQP
jgi:hypothetical protein